MKKIILLFIVHCLLLIVHCSFSQKPNYFKEFRKLSRPEKCWAISHPFIAKKCFRLTLLVLKATDSIQKTNILDHDADGGQVDAFRHTYWMATLMQNINAHKVLRLGKAHEKGNYLDYKKRRLEEGSIPDKISSDMDLCNNLKGIEIGFKFRVSSFKFRVKADSIQKTIIDFILQGKMVMIKKNKRGGFLDDKGNLISPETLKGKWENNKCLVPSNYVRL